MTNFSFGGDLGAKLLIFLKIIPRLYRGLSTGLCRVLSTGGLDRRIAMGGVEKARSVVEKKQYANFSSGILLGAWSIKWRCVEYVGYFQGYLRFTWCSKHQVGGWWDEGVWKMGVAEENLENDSGQGIGGKLVKIDRAGVLYCVLILVLTSGF